MTNWAADDFSIIRRHLEIIQDNARHVCQIRKSPAGNTSDCWCYKAGPNGVSLPCPVDPEKTTPTPLPAAPDTYCDD